MSDSLYATGLQQLPPNLSDFDLQRILDALEEKPEMQKRLLQLHLESCFNKPPCPCRLIQLHLQEAHTQPTSTVARSQSFQMQETPMPRQSQLASTVAHGQSFQKPTYRPGAAYGKRKPTGNVLRPLDGRKLGHLKASYGATSTGPSIMDSKRFRGDAGSHVSASDKNICPSKCKTGLGDEAPNQRHIAAIDHQGEETRTGAAHPPSPPPHVFKVHAVLKTWLYKFLIFRRIIITSYIRKKFNFIFLFI